MYLKPAEKVVFDEVWPEIAAGHQRTIAKFAQGNLANTYTLPGTPHYVYINTGAEVVRWMRKFLRIPPRS